jgi:hypothetical protein
MEFNFSVFRIVLLLSLLILFYFLGGFDAPSLGADSILSQRRITKAWMYCVVLFLAGAVSTSVVDHFVGTMERSNLRLLHIIMGTILMAGSLLYIRSLKDAAHHTSDQDEAAITTQTESPESIHFGGQRI